MTEYCPDITVEIDARILKAAGTVTDATGNVTRRLGGITSNIDNAIDSIERATDCEALKQRVKTQIEEIQKVTDAVEKQIQKLANFTIPLSLPSSFKKILKWAKKLITSVIAPQLEAYIQLTQQLIELSQATNRLMRAIDKVIPRIQQCAIDTINEEIYGIQSELDTTVNTVIKSLSDTINNQLCGLGPSLTDLGAVLNDAAINTQQSITAARSIADQADASIAATLNTINTIGTSLQQIAPITFNIDTSSAEAFNQSIANGAFDQFTDSVNTFINLEPPTNTSPPTIVGTPSAVGQVLTANNGTWTGDNITYSYQWYRNDVPIAFANTATYQLTSADGNSSKITLEVSALNDGGEDVIEVVTTTTFVTGGLFIYGQRVQ